MESSSGFKSMHVKGSVTIRVQRVQNVAINRHQFHQFAHLPVQVVFQLPVHVLADQMVTTRPVSPAPCSTRVPVESCGPTGTVR
jgi:hypothetical protein